MTFLKTFPENEPLLGIMIEFPAPSVMAVSIPLAFLEYMALQSGILSIEVDTIKIAVNSEKCGR